MIRTFRDKTTAAVFAGRPVRTVEQAIWKRARRKLAELHHARSLEDLRLIPGNRLEPLKGARRGQWSIRINRQWRVCFRWDAPHADDVEIADYH
jgi:proteic killer suppression protein